MKTAAECLHVLACHVFPTAAAGGVCTPVFLVSLPQVALIDVNDSAGRSLVEVLEKEFGSGRVLFLCCNVESEEKIKGFSLSSSLGHLKPETQTQI